MYFHDFLVGLLLFFKMVFHGDVIGQSFKNDHFYCKIQPVSHVINKLPHNQKDQSCCTWSTQMQLLKIRTFMMLVTERYFKLF